MTHEIGEGLNVHIVPRVHRREGVAHRVGAAMLHADALQEIHPALLERVVDDLLAVVAADKPRVSEKNAYLLGICFPALAPLDKQLRSRWV